MSSLQGSLWYLLSMILNLGEQLKVFLAKCVGLKRMGLAKAEHESSLI